MNLAMIVEMAASGYGDRGAIVSAEGEISYDELLARVKGRAAALTEEAARTGSGHIAYLGLSGPLFVEHLLAAAWAGLAFVPLNYRARAEELAALVEPLHPVVLVHDPDYEEKARACVSDGDRLVTSVAPRGPVAETPYASDGEALAVLLYTSGTTSGPKAVLLLHRHLCSYLFGTVEFASAAPGETALVTVPPYHIAGIMGVLTPLYGGRRLAFLPQFDPTAWLEAVSAYEVTHTFVVPTMLARIVEVLEADPSLRPRSLRHVAYGGGPIHLALVERVLRLLPDVDFVNAYGLTETSSTVALLAPEDHRAALDSPDAAVRARLGSVGRPLPGVDVKIVGEEGQEMPAGEIGTITLGGAQVSGQYRGLDAPQGRFATGDLGYLDDGGYLFIAGRSDDVIIRGGENISPGEVEDVFARHPDLRGIAVVGISDEEWGQRVVAFAEARGDVRPTTEELRTWARASLASFKLPEAFIFVDELPRTDTGKLLRRRLREIYSHELADTA